MYCTQADIEEHFGVDELVQLTDRARTGMADSVAIARAIEKAKEEIDIRLSGRYALPFATVPRILAHLSCDIALYHLFSARRGGGVINSVRDQYKNAIHVLENIGKGVNTLGAPPVAAGRDDVVVMSSAACVWSRSVTANA